MQYAQKKRVCLLRNKNSEKNVGKEIKISYKFKNRWTHLSLDSFAELHWFFEL